MYTLNRWIICELYLNKAVKKQIKQNLWLRNNNNNFFFDQFNRN